MIIAPQWLWMGRKVAKEKKEEHLKASGIISGSDDDEKLRRDAAGSKLSHFQYTRYFICTLSHKVTWYQKACPNGLKMTQTVAFGFLNFGVFHQFLSY